MCMKNRLEKLSQCLFFRSILLSMCLCSTVPDTVAQAVQFQKVYGGASYDEGNAVLQTDDEGFIIAGNSYSFGAGDYDGYAVKTDKNGTVLWSKTYGTTNFDAFNDVVIMPDKGYLFAGSSSTISSWGDAASMYYIVRTDSDGQEQWTKKMYSNSNRVHNIIPTDDGNFILYGDDAYNIHLGKINANGTTLFYNTYLLYTGSGIAQAGTAKSTADGGFILSGHVRNQSTSLYDLFLLKVTALGAVEWTKIYSSTYASTYASDVLVLSDGSFIVTGSAEGLATELFDVLLLKTDADGVLQWVHSYSGENEEKGKSLSLSCDGGFVITGNSKSFKNNINDLYLIKTDANGTVQWSNVYGGYNIDAGNRVVVTNDCDIVLTGATQSYGAGLSDVFLLKLTPTGSDLQNCNKTNVTSALGTHTLNEEWKSVYGQMGYILAENLAITVTDASTHTTPDVCNECRKPLTDFDYVQNKMSLNFLNYSENGTSYAWDLGDETSDIMHSPVHEYTNTGTYNVKLVATNGCGKDSVTKVVTVINTTDCLFNIQPGPTRGQDASINNAPSKIRGNFSESVVLIANRWTHGGVWDTWRSLLRFDLSSVCDIDHLLDARLSLYYSTGYVNYLHSYTNSLYPNNFYISRINSPWKDYLVNWNTQPTTTTAGQVLIGATAWGSELLNQDVYQLTKDMISEGNHGFMIQMQYENDMNYRAADYAASNFALPEKRPLLQLKYIPLNSSVDFTDTTICLKDSIQLFASGGVKYKWYPSEGLSCDNCPNPKASPAQTTTYRAFIYNCENCAEIKKITVNIHPQATIDDATLTICKGDTAQLQAHNGSGFQWTPAKWINNPKIQDPKVYPPVSTTYYVAGVNQTTVCRISDSIRVQVDHAVPPQHIDTVLCQGHKLVFDVQDFGGTYAWQDESTHPYYVVNDTGFYAVTITNACGVYERSYQVNQCCEEIWIPNLITPNGDELNEYFKIGCLGDGGWNLQIYNRWGAIVYENADYKNDWKADGLSDAVYYYTVSKKDRKSYNGWVQVIR